MDDWQLLDAYAAQNSEDAFRALVDRYAGLVYHAALQRTGRPHAAEEITQAVFIALAQKAGQIPKRAVLSGWLFQATRFAAMNLAREEGRRQRYEQEAAMREPQSQTDETEPVWKRISPFLYQALDQLSRKDREAILLRFFQGKSHREVALALGVSEVTSRSRVARAVDKLRLIFARRGLVTSAGTLGAALVSLGAQIPPTGLTASVTSLAAAKGSAGTASTLWTTKGILKLMAWTKIKPAVTCAGVLLVTCAATIAVKKVEADDAKPTLPPQVREQWEKQKAALQNVQIQTAVAYNGTLTNWDYSARRRITTYFDGNRFYEHVQDSKDSPRYDSAIAFDGQSIWDRSDRDGRVRKALLADEGARTRFRFRSWPYFDAAGIFAPGFITEFDSFSSLEPSPLHDLNHGILKKVEPIGENLRATFQVEDIGLSRVRETDIAEYERELRRTPNSPAWIASEIGVIKLAKTLKATRTVAFVLDPKRGFSVLEREERNASGRLVLRAVSDNWKFYDAQGIWLPGRCVVSYYARPSLLITELSTKPIHFQTNELTSIEFGKKDIPFSFQ